MPSQEKRIGTVGILVRDNERADKVNEVLHRFAHIIVGRMGVPYREQNLAVIALIIDGTTDEVGAMTGALGRIQGVSVKSALHSPHAQRPISDEKAGGTGG